MNQLEQIIQKIMLYDFQEGLLPDEEERKQLIKYEWDSGDTDELKNFVAEVLELIGITKEQK